MPHSNKTDANEYRRLMDLAFPERARARARLYQSTHRDALRTSKRMYVAINRDAIRARNSAYRKANPEKRSRWSRGHYARHAAAIIKRTGLRQKENRERLNFLRRKNRSLNPGKKRSQDRKWAAARRARKFQLGIGNPILIDMIYARAAELRQWFMVVVDHIRPLCRGGLHSAENLQIIYDSENARKGSRLDYTPSVIFT